jgi:HPt (histidine-containing phosphotransfer) domain-containing protein
LRKALAQKDWAQASIAAHGIKSQCKYLGLEEGAGICEAIEEQPHAPQNGERMTTLAKIIEETVREIA